MNNITVADKLGLTGQVRELKLGKSFNSGMAANTPGFHTFRYDFKPASVDTSQVAQVDMEQRHQVSVTVPHHDSTSSTVFRGSSRPYQKECVLIIDHKTGEITLERLSCNVQLKKTRAEGSSKVLSSSQMQPKDRPLTPSDEASGSVPPPPPLVSQSSKMKRPSPPMPAQRTHTASPSASKQRISPVSNGTSRSKPVSQPRPPTAANLAANSMPLLLDDMGGFNDSTLHSATPVATAISQLTAPLVPPKLILPPMQDSNTDVVEMSEGSSSSSSSSGSSSEEESSDSESDRDPKHQAGLTNTAAGYLPPAHQPPAPQPHAQPPVPIHTKHHNSSMPKLSQLSEDLQLSESGSDSD